MTLLTAVILVAETNSIIPRHIDPSTAPEKSNIPEIINILFYSSTFLAKLDIQGSMNISSSIINAPVPQYIKDIFNRSIETYNQFLKEINTSMTYIDLAEEMISINNFSGAAEALDKAKNYLDKAEITYIMAYDTLRHLGAIARSVKSTEDILNNMKNSLDILRNRINEIQLKLGEASSRKLIDVYIEAHINTSHVLYGDYVEIWGFARDEYNNSLRNKILLISYGTYNVSIATDSLGFFSAILPIYACNQTIIKISYTPTGRDINMYRYAEYLIEIFSECIRPELRILVPEVMYVGSNNTICVGSLIHNLTIHISMPEINIMKNLIILGGETCTDIYIPSSTPDGVYSIIISSEPQRGVPPETLARYVRVSRTDYVVNIYSPNIIFTGFPVEICVSTDIATNVTIYIPDIDQIITLNTSNSCVSIKTPIFYMGTRLLIGAHISPIDAYYRSKFIETSILVINTPILSLMIFLIAVLIYIQRGRVEFRGEPIIDKEIKEEIIETKSDSMSPVAREFVDVIKSLSGVDIEKHMTLREYVEKALNKVIMDLHNIIRRALGVVERIIYGPPISIEIFYRELRRLLDILRHWVVRK